MHEVAVTENSYMTEVTATQQRCIFNKSKDMHLFTGAYI